MPLPLVSLALGASLFFIASDSVPNFDPGPGCRSGVEVDQQPNVAGCVQEEEQARTRLVEEWPQFSRDEKSTCVAEAELGGPRSYIELLTCLEIGRDAKGMSTE
jgi:hypothetical protein